MKYSITILSALALSVTEVAAFPAAMFPHVRMPDDSTLDADSIKAHFQNKRAIGFDAKSQYVSNQGKYAFVPPKNVNQRGGDQRGPCPGLNAMANHNYLPHNGVATIPEFIAQTAKVFGMGLDLGAFLSIYGAVFDGDLVQWSIGGPTSAIPSLPLGLLGEPTGISGSHNKYEGDASPTRPDLYQYGNTYKVRIEQFEALYKKQPDKATANYDLKVLTEFRAERFEQSIAGNPYFFNGIFPGLLVQPAAYTFIYRFMGNKSAEHPDGVLNQEVLKSFFSITGEPGSFKWQEGYERIPDNWYKRAIGDEYTIPFFLTDVLAAAAQYPQFLDVGGNTGKTNTYTGFSIDRFTEGVYNLRTLAEGNNFACFITQLLIQQGPDLIEGPVVALQNALGEFGSKINSLFGVVSCPALPKGVADQFPVSMFPGAARTDKTTVKPVV